jgi:hypothetical protein
MPGAGLSWERRTSRGGRDSIDHPQGGHDDIANAVAGAGGLAKKGGYNSSLDWVSGLTPTDADAEKAAAREWQEARMAAHIARYGGYRRF